MKKVSFGLFVLALGFIGFGINGYSTSSTNTSPEVKVTAGLKPIVEIVTPSSTTNNCPVKTTLVKPLNKPISIKQLDLNPANTITLFGVVDQGAALIAREIITKAKTNKELFLVIDSPGGSVMDGAMILSAMEGVGVPVNTVCIGLCASMASIIHQKGAKRLMVNRSIIMFHPASGGVQGSLEQMRSRLNMVDNFVDKMDNDIAKRNKMTLAEFKALTVSELWVDAEDSIQRGFADGLVLINFSNEASINLSVGSSDKLFLLNN